MDFETWFKEQGHDQCNKHFAREVWEAAYQHGYDDGYDDGYYDGQDR